MELIKKFKVKIKGVTPLIMNSDRLCDPLDPLGKKIKELTSIRKKQDEHHIGIARLQWEGSLYWHEDYGVYIPSKNLQACFKAAAKKFKLGKATKAVLIDGTTGFSLKGFERSTPESLWSVTNKDGRRIHCDTRSVVVSQSRVMRNRPVFPKWEFEFPVVVNVELFSVENLNMVWHTAGAEYGLCELRPELATGAYGKFEAVSIEEMK